MFRLKIISIVLSLMLVYPIVSLMADKQTEIELIVNHLSNESIIVEQWTMYASENIETNTGLERFSSMVTNEWELHEEVTSTGISKKAVKKGLLYTETVLLVTPFSNELSYFCYEISGSKTEEDYFSFSNLEQKIKSYFSSKTRLFSNVKGHYTNEDHTSLENKVTSILDAFQAVQVEGLLEEDFVSISAFSSNWKDGIYSNNKKINLQVGLRLEQTSTKCVTNVIVGTPIITIEY